MKIINITLGMIMCLVSFHSVSGCAINPVTKRPNLVLTTQEGERQIGQEEAKKIEQEMGLTNNPKLTAYVEALGQRLAVHSPRQDVAHQFYVVEMVEPNAFALPGGFVYVSRGLLALANSEDELAGVIGHEVGHVAARHSVQRLSAAAPFAIVGGVAGAVTGIVSDRLSDAVTGITGFTGKIVLSPYSRSQEREADEVGVEMAAKAGWDPAGLSHFLHALEREQKLHSDKAGTTSFFDSHPATPERVGNTAEHAQNVTQAVAPPIAANRSAFLEKLDGLVIGPHPANGVFVKNDFFQPDLNFGLRFPEGWKTENSRQMVIAAQEKDSAFSFLQVAAQGDDPMAIPRQLSKGKGKALLEKVERFRVRGLPAARVVLQTRTKHGPTVANINWIAYQGLIYQIVGASPTKVYEQYEPMFRQIVASFHPLTKTERRNITVTRLRIAPAREAETLAEYIVRTGSHWSAEETAVANGLKNEAILSEGQLLKFANRERYIPNAE